MYFRLLDLPTELIDLIVEHVFIDGCQLIRAVLPLSVTCKSLRTAVKPRLFANLTIESDGHYLSTVHTTHRLHNVKGPSLPHIVPCIMDSVNTLKFISWRRLPNTSYSTDTWKFPEDLNVTWAMPKLQTIM